MQRSSTHSRNCRRGISLFEVVLALSIFIGALAAISQVLRTGSRASIMAQLQSEAVLLCEQKMNEVVAGVQPLEGVNGASFDQKSNWNWTLNIGDSGTVGLLRLEVIVEHQNPRGSSVSYKLVRLMRDPQIYVDAANAAAAAASSEGSL